MNRSEHNNGSNPTESGVYFVQARAGIFQGEVKYGTAGYRPHSNDWHVHDQAANAWTVYFWMPIPIVDEPEDPYYCGDLYYVKE